jgi:hypothetical protein
MTAPETPAAPVTDLPLPGDWPRRKLVRWSVAGQLLLLPVGVRHLWVWGGDLAPVLHALSATLLVTSVLLSGTAFSRCARQASSLDRRFLFRTGALLCLLAMLVPPFLSTDVFDYVARGRVEYLGHDPYATTVVELSQDPGMAGFLDHTNYPGHVSPYGPLTAPLQRLVASLPWALAGVWLWKLLMALAFLGAGWLIANTVQRLHNERDANRALVLWLWNPWLLLECCGSGHNDTLNAFLLAATCAGVATGTGLGASATYGFGLLVKHGNALLGPLLLCWSIATKKLRGFLAGTGIALAAAAGLVLCYFLIADPLRFLKEQAEVSGTSLPALCDRLFGGNAGMVAGGAGLVLALAVMAFGCRRTKDAVSFGQWGVLTMATFLLLVPRLFSPWYHLWWLPLFSLCTAAIVPRVVELLGWLGPLSYLVFVATRTLGPVDQVWQFTLACGWPLVLLLLEWRHLAGIPQKSVAALEPDEH